jgi:hypothetical protein
MARARNIKPSFFTNEQVSDNCPLGRLLFIGLWTMADHKGDLEWKEKTLKIQLLPWDECSLKKLAINLDKSGLIRFYSDGNKIFINIPNFEKHQNPHKNERDKGSDIPAYSEARRQVVDLQELTINRDKSRAVPECSQSDRADSLFLNPDSPSLNPEPRKKINKKNPQPDGSGPLGDLEMQNQQNPATSQPPAGEVVYLASAGGQSKAPPEKPTRSKTTFATWLERVRLSSEKPISQDDPIFAYAERIGLTEDMLRAQWVEFKTRYMANQKKYADWRAVFANSVRGNWFKLWWHDGQQYRLTTVGVQAMRAIDAQGARASA